MKALKVSRGNMLVNILQEKCPNCNNSKVFENKGIFRMPEMKDNCSVCNYHFDREPGYFLGAMYVSYALAVLEAIVTFLICYLGFPGMPIPWIPVAIIAVIILCARKNYKLSRIIYMHLFPW
jgi:uncharacterized protein (DUF983 family)